MTPMIQKIRFSLGVLIAFACMQAEAQFTPGQILTATQLNAALAAPAITGGSINGATVGASTPGTGKFTTLGATGVISTSNTTASSSTTTGAITSAGGLGVSGAINAGSINTNNVGASFVNGGYTPATGSAASFFYPTYFGNPATGIVGKFNRIQVGLEGLQSTDIPQTTKSWATTLMDGDGAQGDTSSLNATSQIGGNGVTGSSRTSDFRTWAGSASGGSQGVTGLGYNDDTTAATTPIACGVCGIGMRAANVVGVTLNQFDINNFGAVVDSTPQSGVTGGATYAIGLTAGAYSNVLNNATAAVYVGGGTNAKFRKGIIFFSGTNAGLDTSVGAGGGGVAVEMGSGQSLRWLNSSNTTIAEVYGSAGGLNIPQGIVGVTGAGTAAAGTIGEQQSTSTLATSLSTNTPANCTSKSLGAGAWQVWGLVYFNPAAGTTISALFAGISTTSVTLPAVGQYGGFNATFTTASNQFLSAPQQVLNLATTTTVYLVGQAAFGTSTMTCNGYINAIRIH